MWGLDAVFIVALLHHFTSTEIVLLEHVLLALFAIPVLIWKRREIKRLNLYDWLAVLFVAWGGSALASILFTVAFNYGNANVILIMQKLQPVFAVLLAAILLKEKLRKGYWALLAASLVGAYMLTFGLHLPHAGLVGGSFVGALCALGAAFLWGGSTVMGKRVVSKVSFTTMAALRFAVALPLLFTIVGLQHPNVHTAMHAFALWQVWANLLFQTLVPSLMSLLLYYRGLDGVRASFATIAELAFPATGLLLNWLVLHQTISLGQWVGFAVIWLAVMQMSRSQKSNTAPPQVATKAS